MPTSLTKGGAATNNPQARLAAYSERVISISPSRTTKWPDAFPIFPGKYRAIVEEDGCRLIRIGRVRVQMPEFEDG